MPPVPMHSLRVLLLLPLLIVDLEAQSLREKADTLGLSIGPAARPSLLSERCIQSPWRANSTWSNRKMR